MAVFSIIVPVSLTLGQVISEFSPAMMLGRGNRRRALEQEVAAARAGQSVDLSRALSRSAHRELVDRMRGVAIDERRRLATELATYTAAGPVRVHAATVIPGQDQCLRLDFTDGWQLTLSGMAATSMRRLLDAARAGMLLTGVEIVEGLVFRLHLRWSVAARDGQTSVRLAALRGPSSTEQMRG